MLLIKIIVLLSCLFPCFSEIDKRIITSLKYSNYRVKLTIVNGKPAENSEVPHLISIKEPIARKGKMKLWSNLCGASVISYDGKLLTAAHCFEGNHFLYAKRPYILRAVSGSSKTDIESEGISGISKDGVQWRRVIKTILHGQFLFPNNDIAIAFVEAPWDYNKGVTPIALSTTTTDWLGDCYIAGYGRVGHNAMDITSEILLLARIDTMSRNMCSQVWEMSMDGFICTNARSADVSEGDSGGPLWCERAHAGRRELAGIVSGKNFDKTTLYTRVSAYADWIHSDGKYDRYSTNGANKLFILYFRMLFLFSLVIFLVDYG